jgi:hypothetical protein
MVTVHDFCNGSLFNREVGFICLRGSPLYNENKTWKYVLCVNSMSLEGLVLRP